VFKYLLYRTNLWLPSTLNSMIDVALRTNLDIYANDANINVTHDTVESSIEFLKTVSSIDYDTEYAVTLANTATYTKSTYISLWYSYRGRPLNNKRLIEWLNLLKIVNKRYTYGLTKDIASRARINSKKLEPYITEYSIIVKALL